MYCRIYTAGKSVISYKSNVKEMYFIRQGIVEVFNNDADEIVANQPILYLPKFSYFGDYQILFNLKSNIRFKTLEHYPEDKNKAKIEQLPDIIFMCVSRDKLIEFCDLFPQTAENIKRKSLERRKRFMDMKKTNSLKWKHQQESAPSKTLEEDCNLEDFDSDEEHENGESQKEDMKVYLSKLNERIDVLVGALK